jgi:prefoldin subunit 5
MARETSELEQRRSELTRSLPELSEKRTQTYRLNSDALARERSGVTQEQPDEMVRLREAEVDADAAIRDVQRELHGIEAEIEQMPGRGLGARLGRTLRRTRDDR